MTYKKDPFFFSVICVIMQLSVIAVSSFLTTYAEDKSLPFEYVVSCAFLLLYSVGSIMIWLMSGNKGRIFGRMIYGYILVGFTGYGMAYLMSGISVYGTEAFLNVYGIVILVFLTLIPLSLAMGSVVKWTQKR